MFVRPSTVLLTLLKKRNIDVGVEGVLGDVTRAVRLDGTIVSISRGMSLHAKLRRG